MYDRLTSMNVKEVTYRLITFWRVKYLTKSNVVNYINEDDKCFIHYALFPLDKSFSGCLNELPDDTMFDLYGVNIDISGINWSKDYIDQYTYPNEHVSKMNLHKYLDREVKNVLELHRLHFLVGLAIKYNITKEKSLYDTIMLGIKDWVNKNPFPYGMAWVSPTINAKRLVSLLFVWNLLSLNDKEDSLELRKILIRSFNEHIHIIINTLSLYSSGNNHLTAELIGAFVTLKSFESLLSSKGKKLLDNIASKLSELIIEQNYSDGKNKESA
ncbi:MAG: hypothetical protein GXO49_05260, partial [Chlorobi bacterium]|nr:hypothetical protein [Chlorobiota bacterium]